MTRLGFKGWLCSMTALSLAGTAQAAPEFARVFSDHAVLQRDVPLKIWGKAAPSQTVKVALAGDNGTTRAAEATAGADGKWSVTIDALPTGGAYTLTATDSSGAVTLNDILIGDVLMCGGQSNMQFPERLSTGAWGDIGNSANNTMRFMIVETDTQPAPLADIGKPTKWQVVGPATVGEASAVCYHMAKTIQKSHNVPIGMINSFWGGTTIQSWISPASLRTLPKYAGGLDTLALLASDPAKAKAQQVKADEAWWDAHDKSNKANRAFIAPSFDDSKWGTLTADGGWKDAGVAELKSFDGVTWLRTTVTLTEAQAKTANQLQLGPIDTYDSTWVNGTWVGSTGISWVWRDYSVPAGTFKPGANTIVVRALGGGGLSGRASNRFIKTSDGQAIPIPAAWKYKTGMAAKGLSIPAAPWSVPTSLSTLHNAMIAPLSGYRVKLAAWYQGEANTGEAGEYQALLTLLMKDWRKSFDDPQMPFFVAQLSAFGDVATKPVQSGWAELREAQRLAVNADPRAGLAVTVDFGDRTDIHPTQKVVVGQRLARNARAVAYGENVSNGGPDAVSATRSGNDLVVTFRNTNGGLRTYSSDTAIGFEACKDGACRYVTASPKGDTIVLSGAADATSVRYAWADSPFVNLYSADDLPAGPFQLDVK
jgi:hypothetical protein